METSQFKQQKRQVRHQRVRAQISGSALCPRLAVFRSNANLYAQLIDDEKSVTILSASGDNKKKPKSEQAFNLGLEVAKQANLKKISKVVFDRGGYKYHGRVKAFAQGARKGGLEF